MKTNNYLSWLVPIEIAKKLKKIGFNEECCFVFVYKDENVCLMTKNKAQYHYIDDINKDNYNRKVDIYSIPTWEQVFEWFREKGMFHSICIVEDLLEGVKYFETEIRDNNGDIICILHRATYEEAREALVNKLIELYGNNI